MVSIRLTILLLMFGTSGTEFNQELFFNPGMLQLSLDVNVALARLIAFFFTLD